MRRIYIFAALAVLLVVLGGVAGARLFPRRVTVMTPAVPVILPHDVDTIHVSNADAARRLAEWRRVAEAFEAKNDSLQDSLEITRLEAQSWQFAADCYQGQWYRADSALAAVIARSALLTEVQYRRGVVAAIAARGDSLYAAPAWRCSRNTWTLSATPAGPVLRWRRFPFDLGVEAGASWHTPVDSVEFGSLLLRGGLTARRRGVTAFLGVGVEPLRRLEPVVVGEVRWGWEF